MHNKENKNVLHTSLPTVEAIIFKNIAALLMQNLHFIYRMPLFTMSIKILYSTWSYC